MENVNSSNRMKNVSVFTEFTEAINAEDTDGFSRHSFHRMWSIISFNKTILVSGSKYTLLIQ